MRKRSFCSSSDTAGGREGGRKGREGSTALESIVCARITNHRRMIALLNSLSRAPLPLSTSLLRRQSLFRVGTKIEPTRRPRPRPPAPAPIHHTRSKNGGKNLFEECDRETLGRPGRGRQNEHVAFTAWRCDHASFVFTFYRTGTQNEFKEGKGIVFCMFR